MAKKKYIHSTITKTTYEILSKNEDAIQVQQVGTESQNPMDLVYVKKRLKDKTLVLSETPF